MDTDRLEAVGSPLIEDFLDCDQLGSDSEFDTSRSASPTRTLKRLHIHVDMTCNEYLAPGPHHPERAQIDGLPSCSNISQPGVYSSTELDPFSAVRCYPRSSCGSAQVSCVCSQPLRQVSGVSSFNYPAAADPSLLTPASSAGSPPLQHRQSSVKPGPNFSQAPTPPDSSKMYGYNAFDVGPGSQSASPMTIHPSVTEAGAFDMASYMAHSPPVSHHPSSPKSEVPPQIDPYLGHFTVSGGNDGEVTHHSLQEYHPYGVTVAPSGTYISQHVPVGTPHMQHRMPSTGTPPLLSQPHPPQYRHPTPQAGVVEDLRDPGMFLGPFTPHGTLSSGRRQPPRKKPSSSRKPSRTPKTAAHRSADANAQFAQDDDGDELVLGEDAPEEDKYLFQLRKEFISEKGKGMWEEMKTKFTERHQGNWEKAALQMKVSRAVARHGVWPEREVSGIPATRTCDPIANQLPIDRSAQGSIRILRGDAVQHDHCPDEGERRLPGVGLEEGTHRVDAREAGDGGAGSQ